MWVRSQNKKFLGNYDSFEVSESGIIIGYQGPEDCEGATLGSYRSEEMALMVLDDMQGHIVHLGAKNLITQFVFEMPIGSNKEVLSNGNWI